ncbi:MAG: MoaD/ThiS family protein [Candidatus Bathyarchaeota archaeon]|nr:MoaD/ThiS family protein [Candidatus Termiticorpusculum sp.]MCL1970608.1 MoaD/ThiS family protein [Candidatus Termiticorpusculum sp.]
MSVTVKFVGALRRVADKSMMKISCSPNFSVKDLIQKILLDIPEIKKDIINQQTDGTIKNTVLILVNDREISVLNGLDTILTNEDEIVFIPVAHGG